MKGLESSPALWEPIVQCTPPRPLSGHPKSAAGIGAAIEARASIVPSVSAMSPMCRLLESYQGLVLPSLQLVGGYGRVDPSGHGPMPGPMGIVENCLMARSSCCTPSSADGGLDPRRADEIM
jgi:hypothetical protein